MGACAGVLTTENTVLFLQRLCRYAYYTGNIAYILIEIWLLDGQPLYGGRCVWTVKNKLFQMLNQ